MKRNETLKINLGLENNSKSLEEIKTKLCKLFTSFDYRIDISTYKGEKESTFIIEGRTSNSLPYCIDKLQRLCSVFTQECIAAKIHNNDLLIYAANYQGEKEKFNTNYFLTINN